MTATMMQVKPVGILTAIIIITMTRAGILTGDPRTIDTEMMEMTMTVMMKIVVVVVTNSILVTERTEWKSMTMDVEGMVDLTTTASTNGTMDTAETTDIAGHIGMILLDGNLIMDINILVHRDTTGPHSLSKTILREEDDCSWERKTKMAVKMEVSLYGRDLPHQIADGSILITSVVVRKATAAVMLKGEEAAAAGKRKERANEVALEGMMKRRAGERETTKVVALLAIMILMISVTKEKEEAKRTREGKENIDAHLLLPVIMTTMIKREGKGECLHCIKIQLAIHIISPTKTMHQLVQRCCMVTLMIHTLMEVICFLEKVVQWHRLSKKTNVSQGEEKLD